MKTMLLALILGGCACALAGCQSWYVEQKRTIVPGTYMSGPTMKFERDTGVKKPE